MEALAVVDVATAVMVDAVMDEAITTLVQAPQPRRDYAVLSALHVFDYGHKAAADQMRTSWEKLAQYVGTIYGQDISNELQNKTTVTLTAPVHTPEVLTRHAI